MTTNHLDITRDHCPMTFVKVKIALDKLHPGDTLRVLLTAGEPLENIPRSAAEQGYTILSVSEKSPGVHLVEIQK
ncbi:MAG: sulfurtransferase TusA family protein [Odoribacteraceae bacterium]|jgi:TusA-related sulfurtransferase|nr:sulfurtransferase TusA family protein [Odoribacteraceae bacterium]